MTLARGFLEGFSKFQLNFTLCTHLRVLNYKILFSDSKSLLIFVFQENSLFKGFNN